MNVLPFKAKPTIDPSNPWHVESYMLGKEWGYKIGVEVGQERRPFARVLRRHLARRAMWREVEAVA